MAQAEDIKQLLAEVVRKSVWNSVPVGEAPTITVVRWSVVECSNGHRYLRGYCLELREGRASTSIVEFDAKQARCRTASGRVYTLRGPPGCDADADWVWDAYSRVNALEVVADVSGEVFAAMKGTS
jgi:hypothetical protein